MKYGTKPEVIGTYDIECTEMMFYMYLPIKMPNSGVKLPERLQIFFPLIDSLIKKEISLTCLHIKSKYIYITAKHLFITPDNPGNRPGYHTDGFLTDDINYIWYDKLPTVFNIGEFDITEDHTASMSEFEQQARPENEVIYPAGTLLRLTPKVVHRTPDIWEPTMRTFVKISISKHKYNLIGNSHNHLFDYNWKMYARSEVRNDPVFKEADFIIKK